MTKKAPSRGHIAEFKDGKCPVQLMVMGCSSFKGKGFDPFLLSQMWDCQEDRDRSASSGLGSTSAFSTSRAPRIC